MPHTTNTPTLTDKSVDQLKAGDQFPFLNYTLTLTSIPHHCGRFWWLHTVNEQGQTIVMPLSGSHPVAITQQQAQAQTSP